MSGSPAWVKRMAVGRTRPKIPQVAASWVEGNSNLAHMFSASRKERSASVGVTAFEYYSKLPPELRVMIAEGGELSIVEMALDLERERGIPTPIILCMMADLDVR